MGMSNDKRTPVWPRDYGKDDTQHEMKQVCGVIAGVTQGRERQEQRSLGAVCDESVEVG